MVSGVNYANVLKKFKNYDNDTTLSLESDSGSTFHRNPASLKFSTSKNNS